MRCVAQLALSCRAILAGEMADRGSWLVCGPARPGTRTIPPHFPVAEGIPELTSSGKWARARDPCPAPSPTLAPAIQEAESKLAALGIGLSKMEQSPATDFQAVQRQLSTKFEEVVVTCIPSPCLLPSSPRLSPLPYPRGVFGQFECPTERTLTSAGALAALIRVFFVMEGRSCCVVLRVGWR